jgi:cyclopropane-fatty-acyl-phospholipid synthase
VQLDQRPSTTEQNDTNGGPPQPFGLAAVVAALLGDDLPVAVDCYDGSHLGPVDAPARIIVRSPDALRYILTAPGELGFSRAYVAGMIDVEGDIFAVLALRDRFPNVKLGLHEWVAFAKLAGAVGLKPLPPPPEEARLHGRLHTRGRDAEAISHHYDVSNAFYRMVLGPSMTYSCAVWPARDSTLEIAQESKYELVCRKLDLRPGMRFLDVGCGWGGLAMHAARHYHVHAVGVTLSEQQAAWAREQADASGLADQVEIRVQDYRDVHDGPFDAISSIGMFEHVGLSKLDEYFRDLYALLKPGGRLLNHGIASLPRKHAHSWWPSSFSKRSFIGRYVFPDGELHEVGTVVSHVQVAGFEVRNVEGLREHYALTLRQWVRNLENNWDDAVAEVGVGRARVWRLYMAASAVLFESARIQIHQVLAVKGDHGRSGMPLRPDWELVPLTVHDRARV